MLKTSLSSLIKTSLATAAFLLLFNTCSWGVPTVFAGHVQLPVHLDVADDTPADAPPVSDAAAASDPAPVFNVRALPTDTVTLTADEADYLQRVNQSRAESGLTALAFDPLLTLTARAHSAEMAQKNYFDHHSATPGLETPLTRYLTLLHSLGGATPHYALLGENIYYCSLSDATYNAAYGHTVLMNSPGHRANILDSRYARAGIGIYRSDDGQVWVTEMFLKDTL